MNTLLKEFKAKVLSTNESFTIKMDYNGFRGGCVYYHFMQSIVNNVKLIYGNKSYSNEYFFMENDYKFGLCAIVKVNSIYILDEYLFDIHSYKYREDKNTLQELKKERINLFDLYKKSIYEQIKKETFKEFYDNIEVNIKVNNIISNNNKLNNYKCDALKLLISDKEMKDFELNYNILNYDNTYIKHLCNVQNIFDIANELFNEDRQHWINMKTKRESIQHIIDNKEKYFTENEINFINAIKQLKEISCKNVLAEFEFEGKKDVAKISLDKIEQVLIRNDYFSDFYFITSKEGEKLYKSLGINNWDDEKQFKCNKITKITYRGKDVYIREDKKEN